MNAPNSCENVIFGHTLHCEISPKSKFSTLHVHQPLDFESVRLSYPGLRSGLVLCVPMPKIATVACKTRFRSFLKRFIISVIKETHRITCLRQIHANFRNGDVKMHTCGICERSFCQDLWKRRLSIKVFGYCFYTGATCNYVLWLNLLWNYDDYFNSEVAAVSHGRNYICVDDESVPCWVHGKGSENGAFDCGLWDVRNCKRYGGALFGGNERIKSVFWRE